MRFKTEIKTRLITMTIGGQPQEVEQQYEEKTPVVPRDWDDLSTKVGFGLVGILTMISIAWSTISIGTLLGGGVGFLAAILFDVSWAVCLLLEWKSRFDPAKRDFPRRLGWLLLFITMGFIFWHGMTLEQIPLAVVGACVSMVAKVLWLGIMKHVDKDLSPEHRQWVIKTISEANARIAVAEVQRQVARMEDNALAQKLAIEMSRRGIVFDVETVNTPDAHTVPTLLAHTAAEYGHTVATPPSEGGHNAATPPARTAPILAHTVPGTTFLEPHTVAAPPAHTVAEYGAGTVEYDYDKFDDPDTPHESIVYFAQVDERVRIGTTTRLAHTVGILGLDMGHIVRVEYGTRKHEYNLRVQFEEYKLGESEWYLLEGDLADYLEAHTRPTPPRHTVPTPLRSVPTPPAHNAATMRPSMATPPQGSAAPSAEDSAAEYGHTVDEQVTIKQYDRTTAIAEMVEMIKRGEKLSYNEAERLFGSPRSTVIGWVKAAREEATG